MDKFINDIKDNAPKKYIILISIFLFAILTLYGVGMIIKDKINRVSYNKGIVVSIINSSNKNNKNTYLINVEHIVNGNKYYGTLTTSKKMTVGTPIQITYLGNAPGYISDDTTREYRNYIYIIIGSLFTLISCAYFYYVSIHQ